MALHSKKETANRHDAVCLFISELAETWEPKTEVNSDYVPHGSNKGEEVIYVLYYDEYRSEWTTKDRAFQGMVFKTIDKILTQYLNLQAPQ